MKHPVLLLTGLLAVLTGAQSLTFTALPKPLQFFARDALDSSLVSVAGSVSAAGHDSVSVAVSKNGAFWKRAVSKLVYGINGAPFSFNLKLHAELSEYRIVVKLDTVTIAISDSLVCGDAYLAEGQSNTVAIASWNYRSEWIRSYGNSSTNSASCLVDTLWGVAQASTYNSLFAVGVWEMQLAKSIVDSYHVPVFFLNGAVGGTDIASHVRNVSNKGDLGSIYGRFYHRILKSGLAGSVKALFWYQGESHSEPSCYNYARDWGSLRTWWKEDFPGLNAFYVVQIHHGCSGPRPDFIRETQRTLPSLYPDVKLISTMGLQGHDGCHYNTAGYLELGANVFRMVARDYYGSTDTVSITPPDVKQAYYMDNARTRVAILFDQPVVWPTDLSLRNYFYFDSTVSGIVDSGKASGNGVVLYLAAPSSAQKLTYLPNLSYSGPVLRNARNIGALTFMNFSINYADPYDSLTLSSLTAVAIPESVGQYANGQVLAAVAYAGGLLDTTAKGCLFASLDSFTASVDAFGKVFARNTGTARIRVEKRGLVDTITLRITPTTAVIDSIRLAWDTRTVLVGDSFDLSATSYYHTATGRFSAVVDSYVVWNSDSAAVASVVNGRVRTLRPGGPTPIVVSLKGKSDTLKVTVLVKPQFLMRINFQVSATPFKPGWLADNGAAYAQTTGFGWVGATGLSTRDDRGGSNFLLKSFVVTSAPMTYKIDAPDGEYDLRIGMGDNAWGVSAYYWTSLASDTLCRKLSGSANTITTSVVQVSGGNGLNLTVNGAINYLVIASTAEGVPMDILADDGTLGTGTVVKAGNAIKTLDLGVRPNPCNPSTCFSVRMPSHERDARLTLYTTDGRKIREWYLKENGISARNIVWNGSDKNGIGAASGLYLAVLSAGQSTVSKRLLLLR